VSGTATEVVFRNPKAALAFLHLCGSVVKIPVLLKYVGTVNEVGLAFPRVMEGVIADPLDEELPADLASDRRIAMIQDLFDLVNWFTLEPFCGRRSCDETGVATWDVLLKKRHVENWVYRPSRRQRKFICDGAYTFRYLDGANKLG
jgi:hypothetical protein